MTINFFQTLNSVLNQAVADVCKDMRIGEYEAIEKIKEFLKNNSDSYFSDVTRLSYDDPLCRAAYIYTYVGAHADQFQIALTKFSELSEMILGKTQNGKLNICSLGGGPGSELLGFAKFFDLARKDSQCLDVDFLLVDQKNEWDETWYALVKGLDCSYREKFGDSRRSWPLLVDRSFLSLNLTEKSDFEKYSSRFSDVDLFVLNYVVSELKNNLRSFYSCLNILVEKSKPGAYFVFIDRNEDKIRNITHKIINSIPFLCEKSSFLEERGRIDKTEQCVDWGTWPERLNRKPKLKWNAFYILAESVNLPF
jgi:hypothetical protein